MEIGMGIHGEPGITRGKLKTADEIAETLLEAILNDGPYESGDEVAVLVNGLGATPRRSCTSSTAEPMRSCRRRA